MSHLVMNYHELWKAYREKVKGYRADYLRKLDRLQPYADSKQGQEDIDKAKSDFDAALSALRSEYQPRFEDVIKGMRSKVDSADMTPPTTEVLSLLQMLELRDSIDANELEQAAKTVGNNDAALKTLSQIAMRKGMVMPTSVKPFGAQKQDAVDTLARAAYSLLAWDGRDSAQVVSDYFAARNSFKWGGGEAPAQNALASRQAADVEPASYYMDTARKIVGYDVPMSVVSALE